MPSLIRAKPPGSARPFWPEGPSSALPQALCAAGGPGVCAMADPPRSDPEDYSPQMAATPHTPQTDGTCRSVRHEFSRESTKTVFTSPFAVAEMAVMRLDSDVSAASASSVSRLEKDHQPLAGISFRTAVTGAITLAVLISCLSMLMGMEYISALIQQRTITACGVAVEGVQRDLIQDILQQNVTEDAYRSLLNSLKTTVNRFVTDPADEAVGTLWGEMQTYNKFGTAFDGKSRAEERVNFAYHLWVELSAQQLSKKGLVVDFGPYTDQVWHGAHPYSLYVGFDTEQYIGVSMVDRSPLTNTLGPGQYPVFAYMTAAGGSPGQETTMEVFDLDPVAGVPVGAAVQQMPYLPSRTPYYAVQAQIAEEAHRQPGGASSVAATHAWSEVYTSAGSRTKTSWTAPVAYCGNYSCFAGVVAADITLDQVSYGCWDEWSRLKALLAERWHKFVLGEQNSSIFIVNHVSERSPHQQGLLIGSSNKTLAMQDDDLTMALDSAHAVVRETSLAILDKFVLWNASDLQIGQHMFTYQPSYLRQEPPVSRHCDLEMARGEKNLDCLQVATLSVELDEWTRWLIVVTLPVGAFEVQAAAVANFTKPGPDELESDLESVFIVHVNEARKRGLGIFFGTTVLGLALGFMIGWSASRPLQNLSMLMRRLGDLDFAHESCEFFELMSGQRSRISDVSKLQNSFCSLSRGIEAFARFVPETVVRNIVKGDPDSTQLFVKWRKVTIMFSDIRDFTSIAESLTQRQLLFVLTRYLSVMTHIVESFDGVVAEILGDGLLVFWNTPADVEDHAAKACAAALAQQQAVVLLNCELRKLKLPQIAIRIGLSTGPVLSGNIGSHIKMKFGCLGEPVALANCLEGLCKSYGVGVICDNPTYEALPKEASFFCRRLDLLQINDYTEPTMIYEVIGRDLGTQSRGSSFCESANEVDVEAVYSRWNLHARSTPADSRPSDPSSIQQPRLKRLQQAAARYLSQKVGRRPGRTCSYSSTCAGGPGLADLGTRCSLLREMSATGAPPSRDVVTAEQRRSVGLYEAALTAFQEAKFVQAHENVKTLVAEDPHNVAAVRLLKKVEHHIGPNGEELDLKQDERSAWTGVYLLDK